MILVQILDKGARATQAWRKSCHLPTRERARSGKYYNTQGFRMLNARTESPSVYRVEL